jgi:hypothetical protein
MKNRFQDIIDDTGFDKHVIATGHFVATTPGGLHASFTSGRVGGNGDPSGTNEGRTVDLDANSDNYIYWNTASGMFVRKSVAPAAGEPARNIGDVPLAMLRTSGVAVTAQSDLRPLRRLDGRKLIANSVVRDVLATPVEKDTFRRRVLETDPRWKDDISARVQTTNATPTILWSSVVNERESMTITALVSGRRTAGASSRASVELRVQVYRDTAGNVTISGGGVTTLWTDLDGSGYAATFVVDTASQEVRLRVTGAAAQTVEWFADVGKILNFA